MLMQEKIRNALQNDLAPKHLEIINDSHKHAGHTGDDGSGQTHFQLLIVSDRFEGCNRIQRQRIVNQSLGSLFNQGLHAASMKLLTPAEV